MIELMLAGRIPPEAVVVEFGTVDASLHSTVGPRISGAARRMMSLDYRRIAGATRYAFVRGTSATT